MSSKDSVLNVMLIKYDWITLTGVLNPCKRFWKGKLTLHLKDYPSETRYVYVDFEYEEAKEASPPRNRNSITYPTMSQSF
jgi:hypothetical protein